MYIYIFILNSLMSISHDHLYVGSLKSQPKIFLVEVASSEYHFVINVLRYSKTPIIEKARYLNGT